MKTEQKALDLFRPSAVVNENIKDVFEIRPIKGKDANGNEIIVGENMVLLDTKTRAKNLDLTTKKEHREQLELVTGERQDEAMSVVIAGNTRLQKAGFTLKAMSTRVLKNGDEVLVEKFVRKAAKKGMSNEQFDKEAAAMFGWTLDEAKAWREKQQAEALKRTIDADATVTQDEQETANADAKS